MISPRKSVVTAGTVLAKKYRIVSQIGEGGMGVVYNAKELKSGRRVAIKVLQDELRNSKQLLERFRREGEAAAQLRGHNVARVYAVEKLKDGSPFIVMEYLEGHDLSKLIRHRGCLPYAKAVDLTLQACSAIAEAHANGVVHRDLKPENLYLHRVGSGHIIKVLDFGISKVPTEGTALTKTNVMLGSPMYMSPEQIRCSSRVDMRSDIWSLGVILYELLTGHTPFRAKSPPKMLAAILQEEVPPLSAELGVPSGLEAALRTALSRGIERRFRTIHQFAEALLPFAKNTSVWQPESGAPQEPSWEQDRELSLLLSESMPAHLAPKAPVVELEDVLSEKTRADVPTARREMESNAELQPSFGIRPLHLAALLIGALVVCIELVAGVFILGDEDSAGAKPTSDLELGREAGLD